jgi:hypothetical protein
MAGLGVKGLKGRGEGNEKRSNRKKMGAIRWWRKIKRKERKVRLKRCKGEEITKRKMRRRG